MKKLLTLILTLVLGLTACIGLTACGGEDDGFTGFDIELARKVVAYINEEFDADLEIEFQEIDWNSKEALLDNGTIDLVWNGMTITPLRAEEMCISVPYLYNKQVAVVRVADAETYVDVASMAEANVGAEAGSAGEGVIEEQEIGGEYISSASQLDALTALDNGTIDVAVIDSVMAGYYTSTGVYKDKLVIVEDLVLAQEEYGIAAKKGAESLISVINQALIALRTTGYAEVANDFGLTTSCSLSAETVDTYQGATDNSWENVKASGKLVIGYTVFAPIAYFNTAK